jgi:hypothetical protein
MLLTDIIKKSEKGGERKTKPCSEAISQNIDSAASVHLISNFEKTQFRNIVDGIQSSRIGKLKEIAGNEEYFNLLLSCQLTATHLAEHPILAEIILAEAYIDKVIDKVGVASLLAKAIRTATAEKAHDLVGVVMRSSFFNLVSPAVAIRLHSIFYEAIGSSRYFDLYDSLINSTTTIPSMAALESLDDYAYMEKVTHVYQKVAQNRASSVGNFANTNYDESKLVLKSTMSKRIHEVALKLVRKVAQDPHRLPEVERVMDKFFSLLTYGNIKLIGEITEDVLVSKQLIIEYFFLLKSRPCFSDKAIYLDSSSMKKLVELNFKSHNTIKLILLMASKDVLSSGKSKHELTLGFEYRLMPEETLKVIAAIGFDSSKEDKFCSFLGGYFAIKSKSIEAISYIEASSKLPRSMAPEAFDIIAQHVLKNNPPNKVDTILKRLQGKLRLENLSEFGSAIENIVVPILSQNFEKAWSTAYNMFILPGQKDTMTNLILEMLDEQHRSYNMKADLSYVPNLRLRES